MKVLVVGGGGREHALVWRLARSASVRAVGAAPGNAGIGTIAQLHKIPAEDVAGICALAQAEKYDLVVVGPEAALAVGLADALAARGVPVFGCSRAAAEIEASKSFAKEIMTRAGVPTARYGSFDNVGLAGRFAEELAGASGRVVVKADGLAAGKGVVICDGAAEAKRVIAEMLGGALVGGTARVVVEEFLVGREASCMALADGERCWPLAACEDHKAAFDGDVGPMTGGMGAISPTPVVSDELIARVEREVFEPTLRAMAAVGRPFRGLLYAGLMLTGDGPRVLEFNCRFGDPETQPLMARFQGDLAETLLAIATGRAPPAPRFSSEAACCVVMAARGYPGQPQRGAVITGLGDAERDGAIVFHAGTRKDGDDVVVAGGRVLGVTALGDDIEAARRRAYAALERIHFDGAHYRRDIGARDPSMSR